MKNSREKKSKQDGGTTIRLDSDVDQPLRLESFQRRISMKEVIQDALRRRYGLSPYEGGTAGTADDASRDIAIRHDTVKIEPPRSVVPQKILDGLEQMYQGISTAAIQAVEGVVSLYLERVGGFNNADTDAAGRKRGNKESEDQHLGEIEDLPEIGSEVDEDVPDESEDA